MTSQRRYFRGIYRFRQHYRRWNEYINRQGFSFLERNWPDNHYSLTGSYISPPHSTTLYLKSNRTIMSKCAKDRPVGFKNAIEKVAIVGVSRSILHHHMYGKTNHTLRQEAQLDRTLPTPFSKPENTQSLPFPAKTAITNYPRASSLLQSTMMMRLPLLPPSRASNFWS